MRALLEWFNATQANETTAGVVGVHSLNTAIQSHLDDAISAAKKITRWYHPGNRAIIARVTGNLDAAETALLRRAPETYLRGQVDHIIAHVQFHLPKGDPRREGAEKLARSIRGGASIDPHMRETLIKAVSIASLKSREEYTNVQGFRNIIFGTACVLLIGVIVLGLWGMWKPGDLSLCFRPDPENPEETVCPTGDSETSRDVFLVELVGLLAAALWGSLSLRHINGQSGRFGLPVALAVLKLPAGALSAMLGLIMVRGNFVPGLSELDSSEQILAWAVVLGAAQQLFTGFVDKQAVTVVGQLESQTNKQVS
jgi:hypothetical protein